MSFCEKPLTYDASKSAAAVCKPCQSKPCAGATPAKPAAAAATHSADEEDQPAPQEKAKNPLDLLPLANSILKTGNVFTPTTIPAPRPSTISGPTMILKDSPSGGWTTNTTMNWHAFS